MNSNKTKTFLSIGAALILASALFAVSVISAGGQDDLYNGDVTLLNEKDYDDFKIVEIAESEKRIILTRDVDILKIGRVKRGYWIRSQKPTEQLKEIIERFDLFSKIKPFCRCIECNGIIKETTKEAVLDKLEPKTKKYYDEFCQCESCRKVYWKGSHYYKMREFMESLKKPE